MSKLHMLPIMLLCWCLSSQAGERGTVSGRVLEKSSRHPVPGANVFVEGTVLGVCTNAEGFFEVTSVPSGAYRVRASAVGYASSTVDIVLTGSESVNLVFRLEETVYQINPVTVTATRERSLVSDVPAVVDVIPAREMEQRNIQDIGQAVERLPGVRVNAYGTLGDLKTISIRGSTASQVLVLVDGQRVNNAQTAQVDLSSIPTEGIESIEVVRGGTSALYGADAVGGVINVITKSHPYQSTLAAGATLTGGSFGMRGVEVNSTMSGETTFGFLSYKYLSTDGDFEYTTPPGEKLQRQNADFHSHSLFGKGKWTLGEEGLGGSVAASAQVHFSEGGAPGSVEQPKFEARKKEGDQSLNLVFEHKLGSPYNSLKLQSYVMNSEYNYDDAGSAYPEHSYSHNVAWGAEAQAKFIAANWSTMTGGYALRCDYLSGTTTAAPPRRTLHSLYAQAELSPLLDSSNFFRRIVAIPALRWDSFSDFGREVSPKLGVVLTTGTEWQVSLKTNYGSSFRAPSFNDLYWPRDAFSMGNPDLKPELGRDFDLGFMVRLPLLLGAGFDATYFHSAIDDLILWQQGAGGLWSPTNVGKAKISGLESRISVDPWKGLLRLEWTYTYLDALNKTEKLNEFDMRLPYRPSHVHTISANAVWGRLSALADFSYYSSRYTNTANTIRLEPYHVTNVVLGANVMNDPVTADVKLEIKNIEGVEYSAMDGFPMPGREFRLSLSVKFAQLYDAHQTQGEQLGKP
jgi:outer membrane cobalamin receptor